MGNISCMPEPEVTRAPLGSEYSAASSTSGEERRCKCCEPAGTNGPLYVRRDMVRPYDEYSRVVSPRVVGRRSLSPVARAVSPAVYDPYSRVAIGPGRASSRQSMSPVLYR
eukprot:COSAG01_NODE_4388_length_5076_cov_15.659232_2_plen_111_part_00